MQDYIHSHVEVYNAKNNLLFHIGKLSKVYFVISFNIRNLQTGLKENIHQKSSKLSKHT